MRGKYFDKEPNSREIMDIEGVFLSFLGHNLLKIDLFSKLRPVRIQVKTTLSSKISHKIFDINPFFDYILKT
jgi:hypothetical protein